MSRSRPVLRNPAVRWFEWAGGSGELVYYDRDKQERVKVKLPFEFMPLDQLSTIAGYNKAQKASFYANEVRNVKQEPFEVKLKGGAFERGYYRELDCLKQGAKYAKSIYMAFMLDGEWQIGNFRAVGSSLSAWIDYSRKLVVENGKTIITGGKKEESPVGDYYSPVFEYGHCESDESAVAWKLDAELQKYLDQMLAPAQFNRTAAPDDDPPVTGDEVLGGTEIGPDDDVINLDDIPF